jgi:bifunctional non-homologous end joining protein LigD
VLYQEQGITKLALARYYERMAPRILPHVAGRPLAVLRCPSGASGVCFFQKHPRGNLPDAVRSVEVEDSAGRSAYLTVDSVPGLVALVQIGALELHPWGSRAADPDRPDRMFFDLDPGPRVTWRRVIEAATRIRETLLELGLVSFVKTTGGKGLHVVVALAPEHDWEAVKSFSRAVALHLVEREPSRYVATAAKAQREGRIFIDYLRNARGATAVAPYSTRARKGAPVSMPIDWRELDTGLRADAFTVGNLEERLRRKRRDPWADFDRSRQVLDDAMRALARTPPQRSAPT